MKKNLLIAGAMLLALTTRAQLTYVGNSAIVTVSDNTLLYNGGGMQVATTGLVNNSGNIMVVGTAGTDKFITAASSNFVLKSASATAYGQLYISGLAQTDVTGSISKEYIASSNDGSYQQIGMPFYQKTFSTLNAELGKIFSNTRYSQNEILTWDNARVMARFTDFSGKTSDPTAYYMLGAKTLNFTAVHTITGVPNAENTVVFKSLTGGAAGIDFGGGYARNLYNEKYNTYLQDSWIQTPWTGTFGKNIYQLSNPYLTNLDLSGIWTGSGIPDGTNIISNMQGMRMAPGVVTTDATGTYSTNPSYVAFTSNSIVGDISGLIIKPLQTFVIKLKDNTSQTLNFPNLRRFASTPRTTTPYSVTAARNAGSADTVKQLGVIALNAAGEEMGRTYFVVYNNGVSGHTDAATTEVQNNSDNVIGTFEENANTGGIDNNYSSKYWLYINEVNEQNFKGKEVPLALYNSGIKNLKFEIRENAALLPNGTKELSTGIGFYYKALNGTIEEISQDMLIPVTTDQYSLSYDKFGAVLGTDNLSSKPSRTQVVYSPVLDNYVVRFDPNWKKADIQVFDMSGKLIIFKKNVETTNDFILELEKEKRAYIVTAISEKGEKAVAKILR